MAVENSRPKQLSLIDALIPAALATMVVLLPLLAPRDGRFESAIVVFPPWTKPVDAIARATAAGARLLAVGRYGNIVAVHPDMPDFPQRARSAGAWLVIDGAAALGCLAVKDRHA